MQDYPNLVGVSQDSSLPVYTGKLTFNRSANNKLVGFFQRGTKIQNPQLETGNTQTVTYNATQNERWPSGLWKGEYDGVLIPKMLLQVRGGDYFERGHYDANDTSGALRYSDIGANTLIGNARDQFTTHDRWQINGILSYF